MEEFAMGPEVGGQSFRARRRGGGTGLAGLVAVGLALLLASHSIEAQPLKTVPRVGLIHHGGEWQTWVDGLRQGLRELGLEEGKDIVLDIRETKGDMRAVAAAARDCSVASTPFTSPPPKRSVTN